MDRMMTGQRAAADAVTAAGILGLIQVHRRPDVQDPALLAEAGTDLPDRGQGRLRPPDRGQDGFRPPAHPDSVSLRRGQMETGQEALCRTETE